MSRMSIEETVQSFRVPLGTYASFRVKNLNAFGREGRINAVMCKNGKPMEPGDTVVGGDELSISFPENVRSPAIRKLWEKIPIIGTWLFKRRTAVSVTFDLTEW